MRTVRIIAAVVGVLVLAGYAPGLVHDIAARAAAGAEAVLSPLTPERSR